MIHKGFTIYNSYLLCRIRLNDKSDRATSEQVLDPRTRMILFKMLSRAVVKELNGCISTGKEVRILLYLHLISVFRQMYIMQ